MIMDLVEKAGIDVSPWGVKKDGSVVKNPRANPNYCYEWAFGGNGEPTALCVWHRSLAFSQGLISYEDSLRQHALKLDLAAIDRSNPPHVKSRARDQAKRARNFDSLLQRAFRKSEPIRVVMLLGEPRSEAEIGWDTSKVKYRSLDTEAWYVHSYSDVDGAFRLVRSIPLDSTFASNNETVTPPVFEDQFSAPEPPQKRESVGNAFVRSQDVRQTVLRRAAGVCECCGAHGFKTASGAIFLETHHVIPLSENGPDIKWNVAAICPNDHRRAHYGDDRVAIRDRLIVNLSKTFPASERLFAVLLESQQRIFPKQ
jgi:5-methylcytosine-specific restriction protein A